MKNLLLAAALCGSTMVGTVHAQKCANDILLHQKLAADPSFRVRYDQYTAEVRKLTSEYEQIVAATSQKTTASVTVPVVFHVILTQDQINAIGGTQGIYDRVVTQMNVLNRDFNARNGDSTKIPAAFKARFGNAEISFGAAHRTPEGKTTSGVEIKVAPVGFKGYEPQMGFCKHNSYGGLDPWDNKKYLNIWIVNMVDGQGNQSDVLGYGWSPKYAKLLQAPDEAGVVLSYRAFGTKTAISTDFISANSAGGRTLVHELGHFFDLWHVWGNTPVGSGVCNDDDGISDTPLQSDANHSCPTGPKTNCNNSTGGEMYMNYMDYTGDLCTVMFTKGQATHMKAQLKLDSASYGLTQHPELTSYPTDVADFENDINLTAYPNPTTGMVNIHMSNGMSLQTITVINILGQPIKQIDNHHDKNTYNFDLSGYPAGVYTIQSQFEEGTVTRKIVLQ